MVCPLLLVSQSSAAPGSTWSEEEALIVKAKLHALLDSRGKALNEYRKLHPDVGADTGRWPRNHDGKFGASGAAGYLRFLQIFYKHLFLIIVCPHTQGWVFTSA